MNKILKIIIVCTVVVIVISPVLVMCGTSADILNWATNDNDWIGFWGSYLGSIFGGFVTIYVMWRTIKSNEDNLKIDKQQDFVDELLTGLIEYHVGITECVNIVSRNELIGDDIARNLTIKSEILNTMLISKKNNPNYSGCNKMIESLSCVTEKFKNIIEFRNTHDIKVHCNDLY